MKKTFLLSMLLAMVWNANAQLSIQRKKLVRKEKVLFLREAMQLYPIDMKSLTVKPKEGLSLDAKEYIVIRKNKLGFIDISVPEDTDVEEYAESLDKSGLFESIEYNGIGRIDAISVNDSLVGSQWYLNKINIYQAWEYGMGNPDIRVAIIDIGVDKDQRDIGMGKDGYKNIDETLGWNYYWDQYYAAPSSSSYHGTFVAGIIGAKTNNAYGIAGITGGNHQPGVTMISYCIQQGESGDYINSNVVDDAILDAVEKGAKVINMSFHCNQSVAINSAIEYAYSNGVNLVGAAGNTTNYNQINYPANHDKVFAVGATNQNDLRASFSQYGTGLDVVAPGTNIFSTTIGNHYTSSSGTSFSTPQVSAVIALMLAQKPSLTPAQIYGVIRKTAHKLSAYTFNSNGWNQEVGYGLLDAKAALDSIALNINGVDLVCDSAIYNVSNLPQGTTVSWDIDNQYYRNHHFYNGYPNDNQCTLLRDSNVPFNGNIIATILNAQGDTINALTKSVRTREYASFVLSYSSNSSMVYHSVVVTEDTPATVPSNTIIKFGDSRFADMTITPSGAYNSFTHSGDSVFLNIHGQTTLSFTSNCNCEQFSLTFKLNKNPGIIDPPIINSKDGNLSIVFGEESIESEMLEHGFTDNISHKIEEWQTYIYRYLDGKLIHTQFAQGNRCNINTQRWDSGIYIIRIEKNNNIYTYKIKL